MKIGTKKLSLLLFAAILLSVIVLSLSACGGSDSAAEVTTADTAAVESSDDPADTELKDNLPEKDYNGYAFKTYCRSCCPSHKNGLWQEAETGDVVDDSVYRRNVTLEERFNIVMAETMLSEGEDVNALANSLLAGDCITDIAIPHFRFLGDLVLQGLMVDLNELEYLDFDRHWWNKKLIDNYSIFGKSYTCYGTVDVDNITDVAIILFNKRLAENYCADNFYDLVLDGSWTIDKMSQIVRSFGEDLNGDGAIKFQDDLFAFTANAGFMFQFQVAMDQPTTAINDAGEPELCINTERMVNIVNKMYDMVVAYEYSEVSNDVSNAAFIAGRSLFYVDKLSPCITETFRDMTDDYGIIPLPKYDEDQDEYLSHASAHSNLIGVPMINPDFERVGIILEAMASEGYKTIRPAVYDIALKQKGARDNDSSAMIDIIMAGRTGDFADLYDEWGLVYTLDHLVGRQQKNTFVSFYASNEAASVKRLKNAVELFKGITE